MTRPRDTIILALVVVAIALAWLVACGPYGG